MKGNREQIYEFVKLHSSVNANHGISTNEIAEALGMQRTNVSTAPVSYTHLESAGRSVADKFRFWLLES